MVHERGIKISQKTISAIDKVEAPTTKVELQSLIGKINFIRRFIFNLSWKIQPFSSSLKLKADQEFVWGEEHQKALDEIKHYLVNPPVLVPPQKHKPFKLYLSADERAIGSTLIQEFEEEEGRSIKAPVWGVAATEDWPGDFFFLRLVTLVIGNLRFFPVATSARVGAPWPILGLSAGSA